MVAGQQDTTFVKTFVGVIVGLVALTVFLIALAAMLGAGGEDPEEVALERERAEARLQPVAAVRLSNEPMPEIAVKEPQGEVAKSGPMTAEDVVANVCASCHNAGVLGAPVVGQAGDWEPRLAQGLDTLVQNAIQGIRAMPPRGGNPNLSDEEVRAAVILMLEESGVAVPQ